MKHFGMIVILTLTSILTATAAPVSAQGSIEFYGDLGFSGTDVEGWAQTSVLDWNQTMSGAHAQLFFLERDRFRVGAEIGYQYLLWYQIRSSGFTVDRNVDAYRAMAVLRTSLTPAIFGEATAGFYLFGDFMDLAIGAAVGGNIPVSEQWSIPVKLRVNTIFDEDANIIPIGLAVGASYNFGSGAP